MIRTETNIVVKEADCDSCSTKLNEHPGPNGIPHHGVLASHFGYGSDLDSGAKYVLCESCWEKALRSVGLWDRFVE